MKLELPSGINLKSVLSIKKYVILPAIALGLLVSITALILIPQLKQMLQIQETNAKLKSESLLLTEKRNKLVELSQTSMDEDITLLETVLPSNKAVVKWLTLFNNLAQDSGVSLGKYSLKPGSIATESGQEETNEEEDRTQRRRNRSSTNT